jgi:hypothetical protein
MFGADVSMGMPDSREAQPTAVIVRRKHVNIGKQDLNCIGQAFNFLQIKIRKAMFNAIGADTAC